MQQLSSKNRLSISNFTFERIDRLGWKVCFYSTKTDKCWSTDIPNSIICEIGYNPKQKDLITLKKLCKNGNN